MQAIYNKLLDKFNAVDKRTKDYVKYLEDKGYNYNQAKSAVYNYRRR